MYFINKLENLSKPDLQNKKCKHRRAIFAKKDCDNIATQQIDSGENLLTEKNRDSDIVLLMIFDMQKIYTQYFDQANKVDNQCNKIWMHILGLEQDLYISNKEKEQMVIFL